MLLDSKWEELLADRLDSLGIVWNRPTIPILWIDVTGKVRKYFPDFYLPHYDLFLDPKNPHAANVQKEKLDVLKVQLPNLKILYSLEECKNFTV